MERCDCKTNGHCLTKLNELPDNQKCVEKVRVVNPRCCGFIDDCVKYDDNECPRWSFRR